jgi:hypothetical protein
MRIADHVLSVDDAVEIVVNYAAAHARTVEIYDGLGERGVSDDQPNRVTLTDIGRLVIFNAQLQADDVSRLLDVNAGEEFSAIPVDARLEDASYGGELWQAASALFDRFCGIPGVNRAKRSKLLHAKRRGLFFITDSVTAASFNRVATEIARERGDGSTGYWEAAQRDIRQPEFDELMRRLSDHRVDALEGSPSLGSLTRLRVLDIVCWSAG